MTSNYQKSEQPSQGDTVRWSVSHKLLLLLASLTLAFLVSELVGLNRFLRAWMEGRYFDAYIATLALSLAASLGLVLTRRSRATKLNLSSTILTGFLIGLPCGIVALMFSPLLLGRGLGPAHGALRHPFYLIMVGALSMGWLYGGLAAVIWHLLTVNRRCLLLLLVVALLVGILELGLTGGTR
jgi:hypothetical protein